MDKYKLTAESKIHCGVKIFRIQALKNFDNVDLKPIAVIKLDERNTQFYDTPGFILDEIPIKLKDLE